MKSQKEYKSIEAEVEHVRKERLKFENQITETWYNLENANNDYEVEKVKSLHKEMQMLKESELKQTLIHELEVQLGALSEERLAITSRIPAEWLARYERMGNVDDPIVPVLNMNCSACFYAVLHQDFLRLKNRACCLVVVVTDFCTTTRILKSHPIRLSSNCSRLIDCLIRSIWIFMDKQLWLFDLECQKAEAKKLSSI